MHHTQAMWIVWCNRSTHTVWCRSYSADHTVVETSYCFQGHLDEAHHEALGVNLDSVGLRVHDRQPAQHKVDHVEQLVDGVDERHALTGRRVPDHEFPASRRIQLLQPDTASTLIGLVVASTL